MRRYDITSFSLLTTMTDDCRDDDGSIPWQNYPCVEWPRSRKTFGYGAVWVPGKGLSEAHRVAYQIVHGELAQGVYVLHKCDNPPCFRPSHLLHGTCADNRRDCVSKGRDNRVNRARGEASPHSKLTRAQVERIRLEFSNGAIKSDLMRKFQVSHRLIRNILNRTAWKHVLTSNPEFLDHR